MRNRSNPITKDERVIFDRHPHWFSILQPVFMVTVAIAVTVVMVLVSAKFPALHNLPAIIGFLLLFLTMLGLAGQILKWSYTEYVLTTHRLILREGVLTKRGIEIPLDRIMNISFQQSLVERIFQAGDLCIESAGEDGRQTFHDVHNPERIQQLIYRAVEDSREARDRDGLGRERYPRQPRRPGDDGDIPQEISRLGDLRDRGLITNAEFESKKRELLDRY